MAEIDYDAIAAQYGGKVSNPPKDEGVDAIAAKYGGKLSKESTSVVGDVLKSVAGAPVRAAAGIVGLPQTVVNLGIKGIQKGAEFLGVPEERTRFAVPTFDTNIGEVVEEGYDRASEAVTGAPVPRPQTGPGRIADTTTQVLVSGPGGILQKATVGAAAGVSGEAARKITNNPIAIGVIQMIGGGLASLPFILRSVPAENIAKAIEGINESDLAKAQALMDDAAKMGTPITGAEAIAKVTGKNTLQDIQRVVESSREGGAATQGMMNARPDANRAAFNAAGDRIATPAANPSQTPVKLQEAASASIRTARQAGNAAAKPAYDAAKQFNIPSTFESLAKDPVIAKALKAVKDDPMWGVSDEVVGSVRWLDAAKRWMDDQLVGARPAEARILDEANKRLKTVVDAAVPEYGQARAIVAQNRQQVVRPLENSPVGDIARTGGPDGGPRPSAESMMAQQSQILMPQSPRALNPQTIRTAITEISKQDPDAARTWTRQNLEAIFNESTQNNVGGANQWGGAKFAAQLAGNPSQKENLKALVEATGGKRAWAGFERMLDVMEAQGKRLPAGSNTARDLRTAENLSAAGIGGAPAAATNVLGVGNIIYNWYQNFRFGKNTEEMANILTDPKSVEMMKELARHAPDTAKASALTAQIVLGSGVERLSNEGRSARDTRP
jgi:hypothetical protein